MLQKPRLRYVGKIISLKNKKAQGYMLVLF
jgi:hypothetical protein